MWTDFWMTHRPESNIGKAIPLLPLPSQNNDAPLSGRCPHFMTSSPFAPAPRYHADHA